MRVVVKDSRGEMGSPPGAWGEGRGGKEEVEKEEGQFGESEKVCKVGAPGRRYAHTENPA